jgi:hypothetical protein
MRLSYIDPLHIRPNNIKMVILTLLAVTVILAAATITTLQRLQLAYAFGVSCTIIAAKIGHEPEHEFRDT